MSFMVVVTCLNTMQWSISIHRITNMRMATHRTNKIGWWKLCICSTCFFLLIRLLSSPLWVPLSGALRGFIFYFLSVALIVTLTSCMCSIHVRSISKPYRELFDFSLFLSLSHFSLYRSLSIVLSLVLVVSANLSIFQHPAIFNWRTTAMDTHPYHMNNTNTYTTLWSFEWKTVPVRLAINILYK